MIYDTHVYVKLAIILQSYDFSDYKWTVNRNLPQQRILNKEEATIKKENDSGGGGGNK